MDLANFSYISSLLKDKVGISLTQDKAFLVESRLSSVSRYWGFETVDDLVADVRKASDKKIEADILEALATYDSFFFRDLKPFEQVKNHLIPTLTPLRKEEPIRILSAGCSSGQEAYSIAMMLNEEKDIIGDQKFEITAVDFSRFILNKAIEGKYSQFEIQKGLPVEYLLKYFVQDDDKWTVNDTVKELIDFKVHNLVDKLDDLGKFDIVFCRNVIMYFDQMHKKRLMEKLTTLLNPEGFMFLGNAETVLGITTEFIPVQGFRGMYRLSNGVQILDEKKLA